MASDGSAVLYCTRVPQQVKSFPSQWLIGCQRCPISQPSAKHQLKLQDHGRVASASHGVPVYHPAKFYCLVTKAHVREWLAHGHTRQHSE